MTPAENVSALFEYWKFASSNEAIRNVADKMFGPSAIGQYAGRLYAAMRAMKELCAASASNPYTRLNVFAASAVFETSLLGQDAVITQRILDAARARAGIARATLMQADSKMRSPRQIMLDAIYSAGTGGLFSPQDASGLTSWLKSVDAASAAISSTIQADPEAGVRLSILQIIRDLAIPLKLAVLLKEQRTFEALASVLVSSGFTQQQRSALLEFSVDAQARVERTFQASLPSFPTGDGALVQTLPPALPWYKQPMVAGISIVGAIVGGALGAKAR